MGERWREREQKTRKARVVAPMVVDDGDGGGDGEDGGGNCTVIPRVTDETGARNFRIVVDVAHAWMRVVKATVPE